MSADARITLAQGYSSVNAHDKAVEQYRLIPMPAANPYDDPTYKKVAFYLGKELRLAKRFDESKKHFDLIIAKGYKGIDPKFELIFILEDQNQFATAYYRWQSVQGPYAKAYKEPPSNPQEVKINALYFEIEYYKLRIYLRSLQVAKDAKAKQDGLTKLVEMLKKHEAVTIDGENLQRFTDLVEGDATLKQMYLAGGGKRFVAGAAPGGMK